jgi:hypothetical protein
MSNNSDAKNHGGRTAADYHAIPCTSFSEVVLSAKEFPNIASGHAARWSGGWMNPSGMLLSIADIRTEVTVGSAEKDGVNR